MIVLPECRKLRDPGPRETDAISIPKELPGKVALVFSCSEQKGRERRAAHSM